MTGKVSSWRVLSAAARAWGRQPGIAAVAISCLVVQQLFATGFALSLKVIVDDIAGGRADGRLTFLLVALLVGFALAALSAVIGERASAVAGARISARIRRDLYDRLVRLGPDYHESVPPGTTLKRFQNELAALEVGYVRCFLDTVVVSLGAVVTVPVLFWLDWRLALITCVGLPVVVLTVHRLLRRWMAADDALSAANDSLVDAVTDTLRAHDVVRTFNLADHMRARFAGNVSEVRAATVRQRTVGGAVAKGASLAVLLTQLITLVIGAELAANGQLSAGALVAFVTVVAVLDRQVYDYARTDLLLLGAARIGVTSVAKLMDYPVNVHDAPDARELPWTEGAVAFDNVTFGYREGEPRLRGLSFRIPAGSRVAVVGPSGSGKSTLLHLLTRSYDPQDGTISIDGNDLRAVTQGSLRERLSVVLQDNPLVADTIRENIRLGRPSASDEDVVRAAERAQLHEWVSSLPAGYDTVVGKDGAGLSGGQRQRVAIARAVIRDPALLLLDEVTTALDPATEAAINSMLAEVAGGRTVVSATHRLAEVGSADILVLDNGSLVGRGRHPELLESCRTYRTLWEKQSGFAVSADGRWASVEPYRLRMVNLFAALDDRALEQLAAQLTSEFVDAGDVIFRRGDPGDRFYLIARGRVSVLAAGEDGQEDYLLDRLGDGDHFGEIALLQDRPRTATIRAEVPTVLLSMSRDQFLELVASMPEIAPALEERMAQSESHLAAWRARLAPAQRD